MRADCMLINSGLAAAPGDSEKLLELQRELRFCTWICFSAQRSSLGAAMPCPAAAAAHGRGRGWAGKAGDGMQGAG